MNAPQIRPEVANCKPEQVPDFLEFVQWQNEKCHGFRVIKEVVDLAGDLHAGIILSVILYWFTPSRENQSRLRMKRKDGYWLVKKREEWLEDCRLSTKQVDRGIRLLRKQGFIEVRHFRRYGAPTTHIRACWPKLMAAVRSMPIDEALNLPKGNHACAPKVLSQSDQRSTSLVTTVTSQQVQTTKEEGSQASDVVSGKTGQPPTVEAVLAHLQQAGCPDPIARAAEFHAHYEKNAWRVGQEPIRNWRHVANKCIENWRIR